MNILSTVCYKAFNTTGLHFLAQRKHAGIFENILHSCTVRKFYVLSGEKISGVKGIMMSTALIFGHGVVFAGSKSSNFFFMFPSLSGWRENGQGFFPEPATIIILYFFSGFFNTFFI